MGAADGSIFTRHSEKVGGYDIPYLKGGYEGEMDPVLYLHGLGGAGKWEAYHMALGTVTSTYAPQLPRVARRSAARGNHLGAGLRLIGGGIS